jgi:hypothetical protein
MSKTSHSLFTTHPDLLDRSDAEVLAWLLESVSTPDPRPVTMARLREGELPLPLYFELRKSFIDAKDLAASPQLEDRIRAEEIADTQAAMAGGGFNLHTPERQTLLEEMAPQLGWSAELLAALKRVGIPVVHRWRMEGLAEPPTLESIATWRTAALAELAAAEAAEQRRRDYAAVREWVTRSYSLAMYSLNQKENAGLPVPTRDDIFDVMRGV